MQATSDFSATLNGVAYALKKGQKFEGDARAAAQLQEMGLLGKEQKPAKAPRGKEVKEDER